jgi:hypothetical protein
MTIKTIAAISISVNILIASIFIGSILSQDDPRGRRADRNEQIERTVSVARKMHGGIAPIVMALPKADRELIKDKVAPGEKIAARQEEAEETLNALVDALAEEDFDSEAFLEILASTRTASQDRALIIEAAVAERIAEMTRNDRIDTAARLKLSIRNDRGRPGLRQAR